MKIYLRCSLSKRGTEYQSLVAVRQWEDKTIETILCVDPKQISRATGYSLREVYTLPVGTNIEMKGE